MQCTLTDIRTTSRRAMEQMARPVIRRGSRRPVGLLDAIESNHGITVYRASGD